MANTFKIYEDLQDSFSEQQAKTLTKVISKVIIEESNIVTKVEFNDLKEIVAGLAVTVKELAEAQRRTEAKVEELAEAQRRTEAKVEELAEAQRRTEAKVEELAEAQRRTEAKVEELAEAQRRTEAKVEELAEAQRRTEAKVEELAEAQKKTEETVRRLVVDMSDVKKQLGGLSMAVGYGIEDKYIPVMESFALNRYGADIDIVERKHIIYPDGKYDEINLYLEGRIKNKKVYIIGESKAQPGKKDLDRFNLMLGRLRDYFKVKDDAVKGFMIGYIYAPEVEHYAQSKYPNIDLFKTYQIERIADSSRKKS